MVIFTIKNNVVTCVSNAQMYKYRVYTHNYPTFFSFIPFFTENKRLPLPISDADQIRLGNEWCKNAMRPSAIVDNNKTPLAYLGAFVFIGIMAWRCRAKMV